MNLILNLNLNFSVIVFEEERGGVRFWKSFSNDCLMILKVKCSSLLRNFYLLHPLLLLTLSNLPWLIQYHCFFYEFGQLRTARNNIYCFHCCFFPCHNAFILWLLLSRSSWEITGALHLFVSEKITELFNCLTEFCAV